MPYHFLKKGINLIFIIATILLLINLGYSYLYLNSAKADFISEGDFPLIDFAFIQPLFFFCILNYLLWVSIPIVS